MRFSAIKLAVSAGSKIYANKQKSKIAMSDAQLLHAERQARGEEAYQGNLLEARQNDYKGAELLDAALQHDPARVVVKRPRKAPIIEGPKPSYALEGKSGRFDIYARRKLGG